MVDQIEEDSNLHNDMPDSTVGVHPWELERAIKLGEVPLITLPSGDIDDTDDDPDSRGDDRDDHGDDDDHDDEVFPDDDYDKSTADDGDEDI